MKKSKSFISMVLVLMLAMSQIVISPQFLTAGASETPQTFFSANLQNGMDLSSSTYKTDGRMKVAALVPGIDDTPCLLPKLTDGILDGYVIYKISAGNAKTFENLAVNWAGRNFGIAYGATSSQYISFSVSKDDQNYTEVYRQNPSDTLTIYEVNTFDISSQARGLKEVYIKIQMYAFYDTWQSITALNTTGTTNDVILDTASDLTSWQNNLVSSSNVSRQELAPGSDSTPVLSLENGSLPGNMVYNLGTLRSLSITWSGRGIIGQVATLKISADGTNFTTIDTIQNTDSIPNAFKILRVVNADSFVAANLGRNIYLKIEMTSMWTWGCVSTLYASGVTLSNTMLNENYESGWSSKLFSQNSVRVLNEDYSNIGLGIKNSLCPAFDYTSTPTPGEVVYKFTAEQGSQFVNLIAKWKGRAIINASIDFSISEDNINWQSVKTYNSDSVSDLNALNNIDLTPYTQFKSEVYLKITLFSYCESWGSINYLYIEGVSASSTENSDSVLNQINSINIDTITASNEAGVNAIKASYDALMPLEQIFITNYNKLEKALAALTPLSAFSKINASEQRINCYGSDVRFGYIPDLGGYNFGIGYSSVGDSISIPNIDFGSNGAKNVVIQVTTNNANEQYGLYLDNDFSGAPVAVFTIPVAGSLNGMDLTKAQTAIADISAANITGIHTINIKWISAQASFFSMQFTENFRDFGTYKVSADNFITNIQSGDSVAALREEITAKVGVTATLSFKKSGTTPLSDSAIVGTDTTIDIDVNGLVTRYTAVKYGDIDGDGDISIIDLFAIKNHLLESELITNISQLAASDITREGNITISDLITMKKGILGILDINQNQ